MASSGSPSWRSVTAQPLSVEACCQTSAELVPTLAPVSPGAASASLARTHRRAGGERPLRLVKVVENLKGQTLRERTRVSAVDRRRRSSRSQPGSTMATSESTSPSRHHRPGKLPNAAQWAGTCFSPQLELNGGFRRDGRDRGHGRDHDRRTPCRDGDRANTPTLKLRIAVRPTRGFGA